MALAAFPWPSARFGATTLGDGNGGDLIFMAAKVPVLIAACAALVLVGVGILAVRRSTQAVPRVTPEVVAAAPADCLLPGPPPVAPDGASASTAEMKQGHDNLQLFVEQLEAYQTCRNRQIDQAPITVTAQQKQIWLQQGNDAIDEAHAIAAGFSQQLRVFKARGFTPD